MLAFSSFPIALCFLMGSTAAKDLEITCPASGFKVGEPATVTCQVNKTALYDPCVLFPTFLQFYFTTSSGVKSMWCMSAYSTCGSTGWPLPACGKCRCACEKGNENFTRHRLDFMPTSVHTAGNFSCEVKCLHFKSLPPLTKNNCDRVTVAASLQRIGAHKSAAPRHGIGAGRSDQQAIQQFCQGLDRQSGVATSPVHRAQQSCQCLDSAIPGFILALSAVALAPHGFGFLI